LYIKGIIIFLKTDFPVLFFLYILLQKLGYKDMSDSTYRGLLNGGIQAMKQQGMNEQKIEKTTNKLLEADKKTNLKP
jgi:hypothetical protein